MKIMGLVIFLLKSTTVLPLTSVGAGLGPINYYRRSWEKHSEQLPVVAWMSISERPSSSK